MQQGDKIRNFGFIAHIDAGKTTTTERLLYVTGANYKIGEVDEGTTTTDWMLEEKERGITITAAAVSCNWKSNSLHIIDTPGHVDFIAEVHRSLRVLDGVVVVFCGVSGVQTQSEAVWKEADRFNIPRIAYINKLDRVGADYDGVMEEIRGRLKSTPLPISIPYYENEHLAGIVDLVSMELNLYEADGKLKEALPIPEHFAERAESYRDSLINILTELDDRLLEAVLEERISKEELVEAINRYTLSRDLVPVMAGSSYKNIGIPNLADSIVNYLPSPVRAPAIEGFSSKGGGRLSVTYSDEAAPLGYIFKVQYHKEKGPIAFARIYRGSLHTGMTLTNVLSRENERVLDILKVYGDRFERMEEACAGDIVILVGLKHSTTGDTLSLKGEHILLENLDFPEPVIFMRIEPRHAEDHEKFDTARYHLLLEDPTISYREDKETGQTLVGGMGELHIEIFLERLRKEYKVDVRSGNPQVAHRETPGQGAELAEGYDLKIGGGASRVELALEVSPTERGEGISISSKLKKTDEEVTKALEEGIRKALISGPEGAFPVIDVQITIKSLDYHDDKHSLTAIEAAASMATTNLLRKAGMQLLEPIMRLEIDVPESFTGTVIGDLQSRSGIVLDIEKRIDHDMIHAKAPLKQMFGYTTALRSITQGKGNFTMKFLEFDRG